MVQSTYFVRLIKKIIFLEEEKKSLFGKKQEASERKKSQIKTFGKFVEIFFQSKFLSKQFNFAMEEKLSWNFFSIELFF